MAAKTKRTAKTKPAKDYVGVVRELLAPLAQRGVIRSLDERTVRGKTEFRFMWLLDRRFTMVFDPENGKITLKDLLPNVSVKSDVAEAVRGWVAGRAEKSLPPHRRLDPAKITAQVSVRGDMLSIAFDVKRNQYAYAVPKVLNFCNELFGHLSMYQVQYMWAHMGLPEE